MALNVRCENCGKAYRVKDSAAGKTIRCQECSRPIPVPLEVHDFIEEDDDFLGALDEAVDSSKQSQSLPPRKSSKLSSSKSPTKKSRKKKSRHTGDLIAMILFFGMTGVGCVLFGLIATHSKDFFGFLLFFTIICTGASLAKTEPQNRWSIPAVGLISGYTIMMLFVLARVRSGWVLLDVLYLGIGIAILISSPGIIGVSMLTAFFVFGLMAMSGMFAQIFEFIGEPEIRKSHQLTNVAALVLLWSGYLYSLWQTYGGRTTSEVAL